MNPSTPRSAVRRIDAVNRPRAAFTLVEMLISVGLVMLMMLLFAQIFATATGSMSKQKGIGENDQRTRLMATILKGDIEKRSYRSITAITPFDNPATQKPENEPESAARQRGYFYYSENDPDDDTDDGLQFTIDVKIKSQNPEESDVYGRATLKNSDLLNNFNQPEGDDQEANPNGTGSSTVAEVSYFLRNGVLYRRVMLVRQTGEYNDAQPRNADDSDMFAPETPGFWRDFDYSAHYSNGVKFLAAPDALANTGSDIFSVRLGKPKFRFGHNASGNPREFTTSYTDSSNNTVNSPAFFGRFTHEETSATAFRYPGQSTTGTNNPFSMDLTLDYDGVVKEFKKGVRRGEDILLANVHAFDVKLFDDYNEDRNGNRLLDLTEDTNGNGILDAGEDKNGNGRIDPAEDINGNGELDVVNDFRDVGYTVDPADLNDRIGYYHTSKDQNKDVSATKVKYGPVGSVAARKNIFDTWHPNVDLYGDGQGTFAAPDTTDLPPFRPLDRGADGQPGVAGFDDDNLGGVDDNGELGWPGSDDRHPIKAIQIKIRFVDPLTNLMRELTMVYSLEDAERPNY